MIAEAWQSVLLDPVHWGAELIAEAAFFALEIVILDRLLHRQHPIIRPRHGRRADHRPPRRKR